MTKTEIANLALSHARESLINGNVDTTSELIAETVLLHYEQSLRAALGRIRPQFAQKRTSLALDAATPAFHYDNAFILPTDFVEMVRFNGLDIKTNDDFYEIEGRLLLTNEDTANIVYIRYEENASLYSSEFVEAFTALLAHKIINSRRGDAGRAQELLMLYQSKASESSAKSAQQRKIVNSRDRILRSSRWTGSTRRISTNESVNGDTGVRYDA